MRDLILKGTTAILASFLLIGCGSEGACCEDEVDTSFNVQPKVGTVLVEKGNEPAKVTKLVVTNTPPKAVAHANNQLERIKIKTCQTVTFDANSSYDDNDQNLSFIWRDMNSQILSDKDTFTKKYTHKGLQEITLIAIDEDSMTSIDRVCVLVNIDEDELPLIADATSSASGENVEKVMLQGRGVCREDVLTYEWREGDKVLSNDANFEHSFEAGKHNVTLTIEDIDGHKATDNLVVNVI